MNLAPGDIVLDYSWGRPDPQAMVAAGVKAVCRYLSARASAKNLTAPERDLLAAAGLGILLVFEEAASSPLQGATAGVAHGTTARKMADALGYPLDVPLIVAAQDITLSQGQWPIVADYVKAFKAAAGWPILYAYCGTLLGNYLANAGLIQGIWKAAAGSWSTGGNDAAVVVQQHYGVVHPTVGQFPMTDDNTVVKAISAWDGKEGRTDMAKLIRDPRSGEIDVTDFLTGRRDPAHGITDVPTRIAIANAWAQVLGPWDDVSALVWDNIPIWSPPTAAPSAPQLTHIHIDGNLS